MLTNFFRNISLNGVHNPRMLKSNYKLSIRNVWLRALMIVLGAVIVLVITAYKKIRDSIGIYIFSLVVVTLAIVFLSLLDCYKLRKSYKKLESICLNKQDALQPKETINQVFNQYLEKAAIDDPLVYTKAGAQEIWYIITSALKEADGKINANNVLLWTSGLSGIAMFGLVLQKALEMANKVLPEDKNCLEMAMENTLFTAKLDMKDLL